MQVLIDDLGVMGRTGLNLEWFANTDRPLESIGQIWVATLIPCLRQVLIGVILRWWQNWYELVDLATLSKTSLNGMILCDLSTGN